MTERLFSFIGSPTGPWRVVRLNPVIGESLPDVPRLEIINSLDTPPPPDAGWVLRGVTSNERYVTRQERTLLVAKQAGLGRVEAVCAALIPVRKSEAWWELTQDERRTIFESRSAHIKTGLEYLPAVARRLHHSRDLGEPFDFLTWFEYPQDHADAFEELVSRLRASEEWKYVVREVDIRLVRDAAA